MDDTLVRIKRAVLARQFGFSEKARWEMAADAISELDVAECVLNRRRDLQEASQRKLISQGGGDDSLLPSFAKQAE